MKTRLTVLTLVTWTSVFGQGSIIDDWISISIGLTTEVNEKTKIQDRYYKVKYEFDEDGSYEKSFYVPKQRRELPLYRTYEVSNGRLLKKQVFTEDGHRLKMVVVDEEIETGSFKINYKRDTIVFYNNTGKTSRLGLQVKDSSLVLVDTVDNAVVYITLVTRKKKQLKRGSS